jgi:flavin-dependent dehydrogenase
MMFDVAVVGGGPVGLATAIELRMRGLSVVVCERRTGDMDKACGEGLMPSGRAALERLGAMQWLGVEDCSPFSAIRYVQEDGRGVEAALPAPGGLGVRRTALRAALARAALDAGVQLREGCAVRAHDIGADVVTLATDAGEVTARFLVAADGLHSPLRRALGLGREAHGARRFGLRRHFAVAPWAPRVEVHLSDGVEAYVTPSGAHRVGVAFLWTAGVLKETPDFDRLLARFPVLAARLRGASADSRAMGAGPLRQGVRARTAHRAALVGDAAGYVDAITGEGLSLGFEQARLLADVLPSALSAGATVESLARYERASARSFRRYAQLANALLWTARHPRLRRFVVNRLIEVPAVFGFALRWSMTRSGT